MASTTETKFQGANLDEEANGEDTADRSARRAIIACAGAALCMSAGGLWLVPSEDAAMQLIKLFASVILLLAGLIMFNGLNQEDPSQEVQVDTERRQLRVYEYDAKGRAALKACHNIDDLKELSIEKRRLRARGTDGVLMLEVPLSTDAEADAIRSVMPRST